MTETLKHIMPNVVSAGLLASLLGVAFVLDEKTAVPIGSAIFVCSVVFWVGRKWQRLSDKIDDLEQKVDSLPCLGPTCCDTEEKRKR